MSTDVIEMLTRLPIERNGELSLYRQLRAGIEMAIIDGELPDGAALPSVRRLASALNVAPITVVQAYRDLQALQLIRSVPKRGYFVSTSAAAEPAASDLQPVQALLDEALAAAIASGLDGRQFLRLAAERVNRQKERPRIVAVLGQRHAALDERAAIVGRRIADLNVSAIGLAFEELEAGGAFPEGTPPDAIEWFLVSVGEVQRAARLLGRHALRIVPMTRTLRADVQAFIQAQPEQTRFGVIAASPEFFERIMAVLRRLHRLERSPVSASVDDRAAVERVIAEADAVVIGSLAAPKLPPGLTIPQPHMEFVSVPDERTLDELRDRLTITGHEPRWSSRLAEAADEV